MTDAGERFWPRPASLAALVMLIIAAAHAGCSCSADPETTADSTTTTSSTTTTTTTTSSGGMGGEGGAGGMGGAPPTYEITKITDALAFDATLNPQGITVFFTGIVNGQVGVFKKGVTSDGNITPVALGSPFVAPFGLAMRTDGAKLYVADLGADDVSTGTDAGKIFEIALSGGNVTPVEGSNAVLPRGLEVYRDAQTTDRIVFSGVDPADAQPGVFQLPASGGTPTVIAKGTPLADPSGVAVAKTGEIYVCDTLSRTDKTAVIFMLTRGVVNELVSGLHVGFPCGIALSRDDTTLFVNARGATTGTDEIVVIDVATKATTTVATGFDGLDEPGGMHRAKEADIFAFVDSKAGGTGQLFLLTK